MTDCVKQQFDGRAATYDNDTTYHPSLAQQLLQICNLQKGQRLLDLGSGTGLVAVQAAAVVAPEGRVVALDLSEAMLARAKAKAEAQGLDDVMEFIVGDMENLEKYLPGRQGSFDVITCSAAVPFLQDPFKALDAWHLWLAPAGKLAFNAFVPPNIEEFATFRKVAEQYGLTDIIDPFEALGSVELVTEAMQAAGFVNIQVTQQEKHRLMPAASPAEHAEKIWHTAVTNTCSNAMPADQMHALHDAYLAAAVHELVTSGRFVAENQHVLNRCTVLYVMGMAPTGNG